MARLGTFPTNSALRSGVQGFAHHPTAQLQALSPSTRVPPLPCRPSLRGPLSRVGGRPRLSQAGPAPRPQPSANTPPPAASGARAGPALARCDQLRERQGHRLLQPKRGLPQRLCGHHGNTLGARGSRPSPGTRQPGKRLGGGSGRRAKIPASPLQEDGFQDPDLSAPCRVILRPVTHGQVQGMPIRPAPSHHTPRPTRRLTWPRLSNSSCGSSAQRSPNERGGVRVSRAAGFMPCAPWNVSGTRPAVCPKPGVLVSASSRRLRLLLRQSVRLVPAPPAPGFPGDMAAAAAAATRRSLARLAQSGRGPRHTGASRGGASGAHPSRVAAGSRFLRPGLLPLPPPRVMRLGLQGAARSARPPLLPSPSEYSSLPLARAGREAAVLRGPSPPSLRRPPPPASWRRAGSGRWRARCTL